MKKSFLIFIIIISLVLTLIWFYVWESLIATLVLTPLFKNSILTVFIVSYLLQFIRFLYFRSKNENEKLLYITYFFFGLMTHLFFGALFKDITLMSFNYLTNFSYYSASINTSASFLTIFICIVANAFGVYTAFKGPLLKTVQIPFMDWPQSQNKFVIVQISDLHIGPMIKKKYVENVVNLVQKQNPDLIVITGDLGDGDANKFYQDLEPLKNLKSKHGIFYVTGNHEYYWGAESWINSIKKIGAIPLLNEGQEIILKEKSIWLGGVTDIHSDRFIKSHVSSPKNSIKNIKDFSQLKILLAHQPKSCFEAQKAGYDLMLSGHTHNGQFFPMSLLVGLFNPYYKGLNQHKNMSVYVNAGTGFWGPPLRLLVPSEITKIEVVTKS